MPGLTLEQLQKMGAKRKGIGVPLESLQPKEPSFLKKVGERFRERTEAGAESILAEERKEQTLPETGIQLAGQTAGFLFDVGGEALVSALKLVPGFIKEPVKDVADEVLKSPIGQTGLKAISSGVDTYRAWKIGNPRAARNLESVVNVISLLPVGAGTKIAGKEALAVTGELAGKVAKPLERSLAKQTLDETLEIIRPQLTKIQKQTALEAKRGIVSGRILPRRFERITIKPSARELEMANILDGIVTKAKNPIENIETIDNEIVKLATSVQEGLAANNVIFNKNQLRATLNKAKEESRVVFGTDATLQNNYNAVIDEMMRLAETQPKTVSGLLQARKNFDKVIETKFPKILSNPLGDAARQNAIRDVRRSVNDFIAEKLPEDNLFKARLRQQSLMYDAIKNISQKTAELVDASVVKKVMQALRQNPLVAGVTGGILTYGALMGMFSNPLVIGTLLAGGTIKLGKTIITSKTLKSLLIRVLRFLETQGHKAGNSESIKAINAILRKIDEGEISVGLSIREVGGENLTTKFLEYAKGKTTLSKQEIMDFARRPEVKRADAELTLRKLEEFEKYLGRGSGGVGAGVKYTPEKRTFLESSQVSLADILGEDKKITIYRGIDNATQKEIVGGDYVATSRDLAETYTGNKNVISKEANLKDIYVDKGDLTAEELKKYLANPKNFHIEANYVPNPSRLEQLKIPAQEFADSIRRDLLELKPVKVKQPQYSFTTIDQTRTGSLGNIASQKNVGKNYEEVVFESPITTNGSSHYPNSKNYFAHARGDEVIEGGKKIWREQEIQSDALQKEGLENMMPRASRSGAGEWLLFDRKTSEPIRVGGNKVGHWKTEAEARKYAEIYTGTGQLSPFTNDRFGERIMRERIKEKAQKGYEKYRLPTGETIGKIEGFVEEGWTVNNRNPAVISDLKVGREIWQTSGDMGAINEDAPWIITDILGDGRFKAVPKSSLPNTWQHYSGEDIAKQIIKDQPNLQETFDLTGKSNPQYRRYENWGKFLKNKYGGKEVTDPQGNTWMEIDLKKEMGRLPIEAFGVAPLLTDEED